MKHERATGRLGEYSKDLLLVNQGVHARVGKKRESDIQEGRQFRALPCEFIILGWPTFELFKSGTVQASWRKLKHITKN